jgi:hypothetical protein
MNYAAPCISDDEFQMQRGPFTSAGPSKGKPRAKKIRITESHSRPPSVGPQSPSANLWGAWTGGSVYEDGMWISFVPHSPLRPPIGYDSKQTKQNIIHPTPQQLFQPLPCSEKWRISNMHLPPFAAISLFHLAHAFISLFYLGHLTLRPHFKFFYFKFLRCRRWLHPTTVRNHKLTFTLPYLLFHPR